MVMVSPGSSDVPSGSRERTRYLRLHLEHGVHDQLVEGAVKVAASVERALGDRQFLLELGLVRARTFSM